MAIREPRLVSYTFSKIERGIKSTFDTLESMKDKLFRTIRNYLEEMRRVYDVLLSDVNFFDDSKESVTCILSGEQLAKNEFLLW